MYSVRGQFGSFFAAFFERFPNLRNAQESFLNLKEDNFCFNSFPSLRRALESGQFLWSVCIFFEWLSSVDIFINFWKRKKVTSWNPPCPGRILSDLSVLLFPTWSSLNLQQHAEVLQSWLWWCWWWWIVMRMLRSYDDTDDLQSFQYHLIWDLLWLP